MAGTSILGIIHNGILVIASAGLKEWLISLLTSDIQIYLCSRSFLLRDGGGQVIKY